MKNSIIPQKIENLRIFSHPETNAILGFEEKAAKLTRVGYLPVGRLRGSFGVLMLHDAPEGRDVKRVHNGLSFCDLELRLAVREGRGNGRKVHEVAVVAKRIEGSSFHVFSYVVVWEASSDS